MGLFKSSGGRAQGKHAAQSIIMRPDEGEVETPADSSADEEKAKAGEPAAVAAAPVQSTAVGSPQAGSAVPKLSIPVVIEPSGDEPRDSAKRDDGPAADADGAENAGNAEDAFARPYADLGGYADFADLAPYAIDGVVLRKKRRAGKAVGIAFGVVIGVLLLAYIAGAVVFMGRFFPHTAIAGHDVSLMSNDEVAELLDDAVDDYTIDIVGNGFSYRATGDEIGLSVDSASVVDSMHADLNAWSWPVALIMREENDESDLLALSYNKQDYDYKLVNAVRAFNGDADAPVDATIAYDEKSHSFKVQPEVPGTQYDSRVILAAMEDAISVLEPKIQLTDDFLIQPSVLSNDERLNASAELATGLVSAHITLTIAGQNAMEIDGSNLSQFVHLDENMMVTLDEGALDQWVTGLANGFDTVGSERSYTRADGKQITVKGGAYGWSTDAPLLKDQVVAAIKEGATTTIDIPCEQAAQVYSSAGQRDWGNRYVDVDLSEQYVRFYGDDGSIIWESACISGSPDGVHNTVEGVWKVNNKQSPSKLVGYENGVKQYETMVQYWMAFEANSIGFHDATWQPSFGGTMYREGYGSHGCVNLSYSAAQSLYDIIRVDDVVVVHS